VPGKRNQLPKVVKDDPSLRVARDDLSLDPKAERDVLDQGLDLRAARNDPDPRVRDVLDQSLDLVPVVADLADRHSVTIDTVLNKYNNIK